MPTTGHDRAILRLGGAAPPEWLGDARLAELAGKAVLPFCLDEYSRRHGRAVTEMDALGLNALVVFRRSSVRYLTGFHTYAGVVRPVVVVLPDQVFLCVPDDDLALALVRSCADAIMHYSATDPGADLLASAVIDRVVRGRIGIDFSGAAVPSRFVDRLKSDGLDVLDVDPVTERCRLVLSPAEQDFMRTAAIRTGHGLRAAVAEASREGVTDQRIASAIVAAMMEHGEDALARGQVAVATGWRSGITHADATSAAVQRGTTTFLEFAGSHADYCAPIIRTLAHAPLPKPIRDLDHAARNVLYAVLEHLRAGKMAAEVVAQCEKSVKLGPEVFFHWNFGYPVGLAQRESWLENRGFHLVAGNNQPVMPGMAFHIPAALIRVGEFGVGHSHTVLVGDDGPEVLTTSCGPAQLIEV
jgi:Xaa-Pro dipeptidase